MKKWILPLFLIVALTSCTTVNVPAPKQYATCIDYSFLTQQGIFVSESNSVNFDYEPLGSLYVECSGGWVKKNRKDGTEMQDIYMASPNSVEYLPATVDDAYQLVLSEIKKLRANGVINFKISSVNEYLSSYQVTVNKIIITGMCIRK